VADVPCGVVTVTSAAPAVPAGVTAVSEVAECTVTSVAACPPTSTVAPGTKPVPVTVTTVPPSGGPPLGATAVTVGAP